MFFVRFKGGFDVIVAFDDYCQRKGWDLGICLKLDISSFSLYISNIWHTGNVIVKLCCVLFAILIFNVVLPWSTVLTENSDLALFIVFYVTHLCHFKWLLKAATLQRNLISATFHLGTIGEVRYTCRRVNTK